MSLLRTRRLLNLAGSLALVGLGLAACGGGGGGSAPPPPPAGNTLSVAVSGNGRVASAPTGIDCGAQCSASFAETASVTLTATPAAGQVFSGWGGDCATASTTCHWCLYGSMRETYSNRNGYAGEQSLSERGCRGGR